MWIWTMSTGLSFMVVLFLGEMFADQICLGSVLAK